MGDPASGPPQTRFTEKNEQFKPPRLLRTDDGLDGEIFVFKSLAVGVHTTSTQIVLLLSRIRSFPFSRQTTLFVMRQQA